MSNTTEPWQSHTPGPWEISVQNGCLPDEGVVGIVGPVQWNSRGNPMRFYVAQYVDKKNADLLAAVPLLLEALQKFVAWHDMDHETMTGAEVQKAYDQAINMAKGALAAAVQSSTNDKKETE